MYQMVNHCCGSDFLLHDNGVLAPLKLQTFETGFQSGTFETAPCFQAVKTGKLSACERGDVMLMLMLMLAEVNAFRSKHHQTLMKLSTLHRKQVEYDDSLLRWIWVRMMTLEVKLRLRFFHLWLFRV